MHLRRVAAGRRSLSARPGVGEAVALGVVLVMSLAVFAGQWNRPQTRTGTGDSYWYLRGAVSYAGAVPAAADAAAASTYCAEVERAHRLGTLAAGCTTYDVTHVPARYRAIFTSRPGFPLAAAPIVRAAGLVDGIRIAVASFFALTALAAFAALRVSGVRRAAAVIGATAACLLPTGFWNSRELAEGAANAGVMLAVLAVTLVLRHPTGGRRTGGLALLVAALGWTLAAKPAQGTALCLALLAVTVAVLVAGRRGDSSVGGLGTGWVAAGAVAGGMLAAWWALSAALHLPALTETVQDLATRHFRTPDIADPLPYLARRAAATWWHAPPSWIAVLLVTLAAIVILLRLLPNAAPVWAAVAISAALVVTAHPVQSEFPRLIAPVWLVVAAGIAVLADQAPRLLPRRHPGNRPTFRRSRKFAGDTPLITTGKARGATH